MAPTHSLLCVYEHQTLEDGDLPWGATISIVTWPFNHVFWLITWQTKTLYLYCCNTHGHETWRSGEIEWRATTHNITWSFSHVLLWGHVTYQILYISNCCRPCFCEVMWHIKYFISPIAVDQYPTNLSRVWVTLRVFHPQMQGTL